MILGATAVLFLLTACGKPSSEEFMKDFGKTMCYKVADCTAEKLKDIPEKQLAMMKGMMPTREKCDKSQEEAEKNPQTKVHHDKKIELSSDEISMGQKCLAAMKKATCDIMQKPVQECIEFNKVMATKK